eukprot:TRINITY_DN1656_c0_g1_i9.p3 TRINITY_DN1656_c0_g1~~TRINITY_DN1656_c0_g1_i9.p3  ORF type:complete len:104 (+),score=10.08 TRINITY_DN1656_c0_g1_i9:139-450(+)
MKEQKKSDLHCIFIGNNCIGNEEAKGIGFALQKNSTLTTLNLSTFGDEGAKGIGFALQKNITLTTLNLSKSSIQHCCYPSQRTMRLEMKEQRKSDLYCRRIRH